MSNLFQDFLSHPSGTQSSLLQNQIKSPDTSSVMQNINGLTDYVNVLISGNDRKSLGNGDSLKKGAKRFSPDNKVVTLQTVKSKNDVFQETQYVPLVETKQSSLENFENRKLDPEPFPFPKDPMVQIYFAGLAALGIYVLSKLLKNK
jgi:hypothetical protein